MAKTWKKTSQMSSEFAALLPREMTGVCGGGAGITTTSVAIFEQKVRVEQKVRELSIGFYV